MIKKSCSSLLFFNSERFFCEEATHTATVPFFKGENDGLFVAAAKRRAFGRYACGNRRRCSDLEIGSKMPLCCCCEVVVVRMHVVVAGYLLVQYFFLEEMT